MPCSSTYKHELSTEATQLKHEYCNQRHGDDIPGDFWFPQAFRRHSVLPNVQSAWSTSEGGLNIRNLDILEPGSRLTYREE